MKRIFKSVLAVASVLLLMTSCTSKFEDMNVSPNSPSAGNVDPKFEFQYAVSRSISYRNTYQSGEQITIATFCEYDANSTQSASDYHMTNQDVSHAWDQPYTCLTNLNNIIRTYANNADGNTNSNVGYMAMVWKVWTMLRVTDFFGDIPYTEAASAEATLPKYDTQKEVYNAMFSQLDEAVAGLQNGKGNIGSYDLIYGGDTQKWIKLANTIRLRMALRIYDADKTTATQQAEKALNAGIISSAAEEAMMAMGDESNSDYSWNPLYYGRGSSHSTVHMCQSYYNIMTNLGGIDWPVAGSDVAKNSNVRDEVINAVEHPAKVDPRGLVHFGVVGERGNVDASKLGHWRGSEPGWASSSTLGGEFLYGSTDNDQNYSAIGPFYYATAARPWPIIKYAEACFLKAIAAERGISVAGKAQTNYEDGIKADMKYLGFNDNVINAYLASEDTNVNGTSVKWGHNVGSNNTAMDKIITQKWIAGFIENAYEAWSDHRQYHKPVLIPFAHVTADFQRTPADVTNNTPNAYIKRGFYPAGEQTTNGENLQEAISRLGGSDNIQKNVWWDVD